MASSATAITTIAEPSMSVRQKSELVHRYALELGPAFRYTNALRPALISLAEQFLQFNRLALTYLLLGCNVLALQSLLVMRSLIRESIATLSKVTKIAWNSKQIRRLRKKLEFEFFVLILGCGNTFCLAILWPGWIIIGLAYLTWTWAG